MMFWSSLTLLWRPESLDVILDNLVLALHHLTWKHLLLMTLCLLVFQIYSSQCFVHCVQLPTVIECCTMPLSVATFSVLPFPNIPFTSLLTNITIFHFSNASNLHEEKHTQHMHAASNAHNCTYFYCIYINVTPMHACILAHVHTLENMKKKKLQNSPQ